MTCSLNDVTTYEANYKEIFKDTRIQKKVIVKDYYQRDHYSNDLAFGCLSLGLDFNYDTNSRVQKIAELISKNDTLALKKKVYEKNFDLF